MAQNLDQEALAYHRSQPHGKIAVTPTKPLTSQRDLSLAYSPGVAAACRAIVDNPQEADELTARSNLVAVITNGTAVLGLGNIGPLAAKPVMEGKGVLFKKFAGIDVFDIEVDANDPDHFCQVVRALEPSFGGINLEDIKAPECFEIERRLRREMSIPVFHDDQHGTAIIVGAAALNGLEIVGKSLSDVKIVASGAGAAALACLAMLESLGAKKENIWVSDLEGVVYEGRTKLMDEYKGRYAKPTNARHLADIIGGADIFLGLSAAGVLKSEMVAKMADNPLIFALANPTPEILPEEVMAVRQDAIMATGRSDYPNQVNNVLCFPFIFRGALDVGATNINEEMKRAAARAIADLARKEVVESVANAYGEASIFGRNYIIPKPFDPRLILEIAPAVAAAAMETGVARRPIKDFDLYRQQLESFVYRSGTVMKPVYARAAHNPKRIAYAEGEDDRVLRAVRTVIDEKLAKPILIGRKRVILQKIQNLALRLQEGVDFEIYEPGGTNPKHSSYWQEYHRLMGRSGVSQSYAQVLLRTRMTVIGAMMLRQGDCDGLICGTVGHYDQHVQHIRDTVGTKLGVNSLSTINMLVLNKGVFFFTDTHVNYEPDVETLAEIAKLSAEAVQRFGITPRIAMLSHSNFGSSSHPTARKVREAVQLLQNTTDYEVEGEMHADTALNSLLRESLLQGNRLGDNANLFVMPSLDAANIAYNCVKMLGDGLSVGPILVGAGRPVHIMTTASTSRNIVNMTAMTVVEAQIEEQGSKMDKPA